MTDKMEGPAGPVPDAIFAHYERALEAEDAGDTAAAAAAYKAYLAEDPEDFCGAAVRLAALGHGPSPERASPAYVSALFNQNAEEFELTLVHALGYTVPSLMVQRFAELGLGPFDRGLDLGCGTGLGGEALDELVEGMTGVDLAERMLDVAAEKEVYTDLFRADAVAFLEGVEEAPWDLVIATDVMPYLGDLSGILDGIKRCTAPGGIVSFSTETLPEEAFQGADYVVGTRHRFAHRKAALADQLGARGFEILEINDIMVRFEGGKPVPGLLVIARAP